MRGLLGRRERGVVLCCFLEVCEAGVRCGVEEGFEGVRGEEMRVLYNTTTQHTLF